ncbi:asparagine synthase [Candidatus Woesearchaeota archaeon]|nr:asparagine synthase [Candidatus Woesearchaeota archaeon]
MVGVSSGIRNLEGFAQNDIFNSYRGNTDHLNEKLRQALINDLRLDATEQVVHVALSGGIDSSLVAGILGIELGKDIWAYTVCDYESPDMGYARLMVDFLRERGVKVHWTAKPLSREEQKIDYALLEEQLGIDPKTVRGSRTCWQILYGWLNRLISPHEGFKIVTGDAADTLMGSHTVQKPTNVNEHPHYLLVEPTEDRERDLIAAMRLGDRKAALQYYRLVERTGLFVQEERYSRYFSFEPCSPFFSREVMLVSLEYGLDDLVDDTEIKKPLKYISRTYGYVPPEIIQRPKYGLALSVMPQWAR